MTYVIGIDEAGRGALAGPVCVGAVLMPVDFPWQEAFALITRRGEPKLRDSKQLTEPQREVLYAYIVSHADLRYAAALVPAAQIDARGIVPAVHQASGEALDSLHANPGETQVLLDAGLKVGQEWRQEAFVKGDATIPVIALASMVAKVTRDRYMKNIAEDFPQYGFEVHKGYGTVLHRNAIRSHGSCELHRRSFVHI